MKNALMHPADKIVQIMNRLYYNGMTTTSGGNLSIMDKNGDMWISPSGVDKGSLVRDDIMCVRADGSVVGKNRPSVEWPFHLSVLRARPDLGAILHAHPPALVSFSLMRKIPNVTLLPDTAGLCGKISMARYAVPGSQTLGDIIAAEFKKGYNTVMLENHGVVIGAKTLDEAFRRFEVLDHAARVEIAAYTMGKCPKGLESEQLAAYQNYTPKAYDGVLDAAPCDEEIDLRTTIVKMAERAYRLQLFTAVDGVWSARLPEGGQIITPEGNDPYRNDATDPVRVVGDACEVGKTPSRYAAICQALYDKYPEFKSIIIARPYSGQAFAHTDATFDARLIPESYIQLKNVPVLPFMSLLEDPDAVLAAISPKNPVAIVKGEGIISCGTSPLSAFDHMEVLEYSARALVSAAAIGAPVVTLTPEQVTEIEVTFNL